MKLKTAITAVVTAISVSAPAYADVLGTVVDNIGVDFGGGTYLHNVTYLPSQGSAGMQKEYFVEYKPNSDVIPVVENGESVWGRRNLGKAAQYITDSGYRPLIGVNGDFFSFQTGIPMGVSVSNGELLTKIDGYIDAIGFKNDGTAFIGGLDIKTTIHHNGASANVECINRWYTKDYTPICLLTDKFSDTTHTESECLFLICSPAEGSLSIGKELKLTVDEKFVYNGEVSIPDGKMMIVISTAGEPGLYSFVDGMAIGDTVTITNEAAGDSRWNEAENIIGSAAGKLITNGQIASGLEKTKAPRTAVGIKADGNIIFYAIDGRQQEKGIGVGLGELALRMQELGCVDALNLDGGGSTMIGGVYPGKSSFEVINSPADGKERACGNYIFLRDSRKPTGIPYHVNFVDDANRNYLSLTAMKVEYDLIYDTHGYVIDVPASLEYMVNNAYGASSTVSPAGVISFTGEGETTVAMNVNGVEMTGFTYSVFDEPDNMHFGDEATGKEIGEIYLKKGENYTVNLKALPYVNGTEILSDDSCFEWSVVGDIGTIDAAGNFIAKTDSDTAGKIVVKKGDFKKELNVFISAYSGETEIFFADIEGHWAQGRIEYMAQSGIVNGVEIDQKMYFLPDNNMTRAEFAQIVAKGRGYTLEFYEDEAVPYTDMEEIPLWARNAIRAMYSEGIMTGRSDDNGVTYRFDANANITRAEAMTVLGRMVESQEKKLDFADKAQIPVWAQQSVSKLYAIGAIQGYSDNTIKPNDNVKRAEAVTMLEKLMK